MPRKKDERVIDTARQRELDRRAALEEACQAAEAGVELYAPVVR